MGFGCLRRLWEREKDARARAILVGIYKTKSRNSGQARTKGPFAYRAMTYVESSSLSNSRSCLDEEFRRGVNFSLGDLKDYRSGEGIGRLTMTCCDRMLQG